MSNTTTNNATTKVDFFQSSRTLTIRTAEFFRVVIKKAEVNTVYSAKIESNDNSIATIDDMLENGSELNVTKEELFKMRENYVVLNDALKKEWNKLLAEQATFSYNEHDKVFKKAMKNATDPEDVTKAVREFYAAYNLKIDNTTFEQAVLESIGKKINVRTLVNSNGKKALIYDVTNALKNLYAVGFEWMVKAGTIKNADIPSVLVEKYGKKNKKKNK